MSRCFSTNDLEVHHKRRDGGNDIDNAMVLCQNCHANTSTYGVEGKSPPPFLNKTKEAAKKIAEYRCECEKEDCHLSEEEERHRIITEAVSKPKYYL